MSIDFLGSVASRLVADHKAAEEEEVEVHRWVLHAQAAAAGESQEGSFRVCGGVVRGFHPLEGEHEEEGGSSLLICRRYEPTPYLLRNGEEGGDCTLLCVMVPNQGESARGDNITEGKEEEKNQSRCLVTTTWLSFACSGQQSYTGSFLRLPPLP